jgi:hypothetical protein
MLFCFSSTAFSQVHTGKVVEKHKTINGYPAIIIYTYYHDNKTLYTKEDWTPQFDSRSRFAGYKTTDRRFSRYNEETGRQVQTFKSILNENKHARKTKYEWMSFDYRTGARRTLSRHYYNIYEEIKRHVTYYLQPFGEDRPVMRYLYTFDRDSGTVQEETIEYTDETRTQILQRCTLSSHVSERNYPIPRWCSQY